MTDLTLAPFIDDFVFLEGPRWRNGLLWVSDVNDKRVYTITPTGERKVMAEVSNRPSGIGFLPDGTPLVVSMRDNTLRRIEGNELPVHGDVSALVKGEINDMVVDKKGNAYVGNIGFDIFKKEKFKPTNFVLVTAVGNVREVATDLHVPNGPVVTPDGKTLIVAESWANRLTAFSINDDGSLCDRRVFADLGDAAPDGICLDAEGAVWLAAFNQDHFIRVLEGGEITHRVKVVKRSPVACTLGGPDGCTLFGLTYQGSIADMGRGKAASRVEIATVDVPASGWP